MVHGCEAAITMIFDKIYTFEIVIHSYAPRILLRQFLRIFLFSAHARFQCVRVENRMTGLVRELISIIWVEASIMFLVSVKMVCSLIFVYSILFLGMKSTCAVNLLSFLSW